MTRSYELIRNSLLALSTTCEPEELVRILNDLFARFDKLASVSIKDRFLKIIKSTSIEVIIIHTLGHSSSHFHISKITFNNKLKI